MSDAYVGGIKHLYRDDARFWAQVDVMHAARPDLSRDKHAENLARMRAQVVAERTPPERVFEIVTEKFGYAMQLVDLDWLTRP